MGEVSLGLQGGVIYGFCTCALSLWSLASSSLRQVCLYTALRWAVVARQVLSAYLEIQGKVGNPTFCIPSHYLNKLNSGNSHCVPGKCPTLATGTANTIAATVNTAVGYTQTRKYTGHGTRPDYAIMTTHTRRTYTK